MAGDKGAAVEALARLPEAMQGEYPYSLVILDSSMPGMDGRQLTKELVGSRHRPRVIVMSGSEILAPSAAGTLGADAVISKPFTRQQLVEAIKGTHSGSS